MDKTFTPSIDTFTRISGGGRQGRPSATTMAFIKQFARAYHVETRLSRRLNSLILS